MRLSPPFLIQQNSWHTRQCQLKLNWTERNKVSRHCMQGRAQDLGLEGGRVTCSLRASKDRFFWIKKFVKIGEKKNYIMYGPRWEKQLKITRQSGKFCEWPLRRGRTLILRSSSRRWRSASFPEIITDTSRKMYTCMINQCCGAGASGAEIVLRPGAGAENKF